MAGFMWPSPIERLREPHRRQGRPTIR